MSYPTKQERIRLAALGERGFLHPSAGWWSRCWCCGRRSYLYNPSYYQWLCLACEVRWVSKRPYEALSRGEKISMAEYTAS